EALTVGQHVQYFQAAYGISSPARAEELIERLGYAACRGQRASTFVGRHQAETEPDACPDARPAGAAAGRAAPGLRLADLPRLLGPGRRAESRRDRDRGHQPSGLRARA